jgi:adenosine kinase
MSALICGSLAYDTIMVFQDQFKNHILPDKVHVLNVSFLVPRMRREFGGCAGNIAYNLKLLGADPLPMATVGIVAPDGREAMLQHVDEFSARKIPFIFDPGQAMPLFSGEEFRAFIERADYVTVNDYESMLLQRNTGWSEKEITDRVKAYIVTRGPQGSLIHTRGETFEIPAAHERRVSDPTGCGDAYRAGLIFSIMRGMDWPTVGRVASLMGALKVEHPGTQNQRFTYDEFADQFRQQFGYSLD